LPPISEVGVGAGVGDGSKFAASPESEGLENSHSMARSGLLSYNESVTNQDGKTRYTSRTSLHTFCRKAFRA